jgi:hypothetical protein
MTAADQDQNEGGMRLIDVIVGALVWALQQMVQIQQIFMSAKVDKDEAI